MKQAPFYPTSPPQLPLKSATGPSSSLSSSLPREGGGTSLLGAWRDSPAKSTVASSRPRQHSSMSHDRHTTPGLLPAHLSHGGCPPTPPRHPLTAEYTSHCSEPHLSGSSDGSRALGEQEECCPCMQIVCVCSPSLTALCLQVLLVRWEVRLATLGIVHSHPRPRAAVVDQVVASGDELMARNTATGQGWS